MPFAPAKAEVKVEVAGKPEERPSVAPLLVAIALLAVGVLGVAYVSKRR